MKDVGLECSHDSVFSSKLNDFCQRHLAELAANNDTACLLTCVACYMRASLLSNIKVVSKYCPMKWTKSAPVAVWPVKTLDFFVFLNLVLLVITEENQILNQKQNQSDILKQYLHFEVV